MLKFKEKVETCCHSAAAEAFKKVAWDQSRIEIIGIFCTIMLCKTHDSMGGCLAVETNTCIRTPEKPTL